AQCEPILGHIERGKAEGARLVCGGHALTGAAKGRFIAPTVFVDVDNSMSLAREEIFGPVLSVIRFDNEDEAIRIANDTRFGLAAGLWTSDLARAHRIVPKLRAGTVWVNDYRVVTPEIPVGGYRQSGIGRELGPDM